MDSRVDGCGNADDIHPAKGRCVNTKYVISIIPGIFPDSKVHGAIVGPTWGRQDPGGPHVGHMKLAIWVKLQMAYIYIATFYLPLLSAYRFEGHIVIIQILPTVWYNVLHEIWISIFFPAQIWNIDLYAFE